MSGKVKTVDHIGKVQEITHENVMVKILSHSACSGCHAKTVCGIADSVEKTVVIHKSNHNFFQGQDVKVILKQSLGFKALFLGYLAPFIVVVFTLILLTSLGVSEVRSGIASLSVLIPYYFSLYLLKDKFTKQFTFDIESLY